MLSYKTNKLFVCQCNQSKGDKMNKKEKKNHTVAIQSCQLFLFLTEAEGGLP
jgi:hypothetical protein